MLELARLLCPQHGKYAVWIAFFDGEEAVKVWSDLTAATAAARCPQSLPRAATSRRSEHFCWRTSVGGARPGSCAKTIPRRHWSISFGTPQLIWAYSAIFPNESTSAEDDHLSFLKRGVPSVDVIGDFLNNGYWHTPQDALDKISPKTLAIVGHVFLENVKQLQAK